MVENMEKPKIEILVDADRIVSAIDQAIQSELTAFDYGHTKPALP